MELIYFWIEKYKILKNEEIHLNKDYDVNFKYNEDKSELNIEENNKKIPSKFFQIENENIINSISCIVGNNGSEKSSIINALLNTNTFEGASTFKYIKIYKNLKNTIEIYTNIDEDKLKINKKVEVKRKEENIVKIFYNSNFEINENYNGITKICDISSSSEIRSINLENEDMILEASGEKYLIYLNNQFSKRLLIAKLKKVKGENNILDYIMYDELKNIVDNRLKQVKIEVIKISSLNKRSELREFIELYNSFFVKSIKSEKEYFINEFMKSGLVNLIFKILEKRDIERLVETIRNTLIQEDNNMYEEILTIVEKEEKNIKKLQKANSQVRIGILKTELRYYLSLDEKYFKRNDLKEVEIILNIEDHIETLYTQLMDNTMYHEFLMEYVVNYSINDEFSSGEKNALNLFLKLEEVIKGIKRIKHLQILIEEIESFMHPEWQRKSIELLISIGESLKKYNFKSVQYILTTHTPFLVCDIPKRRIISMKNKKIDKEISTGFGSNILDILKSDFGLSSLFGEFTKKKIKRVIELLSKDDNGKYNSEEIEKNKEEIEFTIDSVGEKIIKNKLLSMYKEYEEDKTKINSDDEIKEYFASKGLFTLKDVLEALKSNKLK